MVAVNDGNRNMLRFLWLKEPNKLDSDLQHLRFTRLVFDLRPSPAILGSTIRQHLDTQTDSEPEQIRLLKNSLYVDDLITGEESDDKAFELSVKAKSIMKRGAFNLRKWKTNSSDLQKRLDQCEVNTTTKPNPVTEEDESYAKTVTGPSIDPKNESTVKVLGSIWNTTSDELEFNLSDLAKQAQLLPPTRRSLLKISAKIFDPLGLLSPFSIKCKVLFQILCNENMSWDEELNDEHFKTWHLLIDELQTLNDVSVPRCYFVKHNTLESLQLHCFSDASVKAYAAAVYLRTKYTGGQVDVNLVAAKTRVAPVKKTKHTQTGTAWS